MGSNPTLSASLRPRANVRWFTREGALSSSENACTAVAVKLSSAVVLPWKHSLNVLRDGVSFASDLFRAPFIQRCVLFLLLLLTVPTTARAATGFLSASTIRPLAGTTMTFTANIVPAVGGPTATLDFGDGTGTVTVGPVFPATVNHVYGTPGEFFASLRGTTIRTIVIPIFALAPSPRVPHGIIFSTVPLVSPVLAGNTTNIAITYRVMTPDTGFVSNAPQLAAIVDLLDEHDHLIARGDPVLLPYFAFSGGGIETAHIPYTVPSDARGQYHIRVFLRTPDLGGTIAMGDPARLSVVGGPDPEAKYSAAIHVNGSIEVGPSTGIGGTGGTLPAGAAQTTFNANITAGAQTDAYTFTGATTLNPTSLRIDPLLTLLPGTVPVTSPNAQQPTPVAPSAAGSPAPHYEDMLGPVTAQLPALLFSGGETLRGLYSIVNTGGWSYQAALGFPQLASATTGGQEGYLLNFGRPFSMSQILHLTFLQNIDDPYTFVPTNANKPQDTRAGGAEFDQSIGQHLTFMIGGAASGATPELIGGPTTSDGADKAALTYASGANSLNLEYHNFGANFATGNGAGATSDSAGASGQASFGLSRLATLALSFGHEFKRSAVYADSQENATFNLASPQGLALSLGGGSDHTLSSGSDSTTHQYNVTLGKSASVSTVTFTGSLATVADKISPASDGVTRTGTLQYSITHGASSISFGVNATGNQVGTPSAVVAESAVISFPLGAKSTNAPPSFGSGTAFAQRGFEIQLTGSNANQTGMAAGSRDAVFGALVSYHLGSHVTLGLHASTDRHTDLVTPSNTGTANTLRVRMDVML